MKIYSWLRVFDNTSSVVAANFTASSKRAFAHEKFKIHRDAMNTIGVRVKVFDGEKCVYQHEIGQPNENDLKTLLRDLRDTQLRVNDFLTTLVQQQNASGSAQNTADRAISSDIESDFVEEEEEEEVIEEEKQVNPKKCKLSM